MKFLLFDMDDVLLKPGAYHQALWETVRLVAASLGYGELSLSQADIQAFEAAGVYSEWDTTAICAVLMLAAAWQYDPAIQLPNTIMVEPGVRLPVQPPEFSSFARRLGGPELQELRPLQRAERLLLDGQHGFTPDQSEGIRHILHTARAADDSLTHCTFQELVLGSDVYAQAYQRPAVLNAQSYLQRYDVPLVPAETVGSIRRWLKNPTHSAAIFTSRPSRPLPGVFSTPEAEMGAALVGLEELPIIGLGSLFWLSQQRQAGAQAFVKPSPVHVLSALLLALGYPPLTCLQEAATLALDGSASEFWKNLEGAEIAVFDDSPAGLGSAASARDCLASAGISIDLQVFGIAGDSQKIAALQNLGAKTCPDLTAALKLLAFNPEA